MISLLFKIWITLGMISFIFACATLFSIRKNKSLEIIAGVLSAIFVFGLIVGFLSFIWAY